jgi:RNA polymerase sigma factor (TIGR02999 family)
MGWTAEVPEPAVTDPARQRVTVALQALKAGDAHAAADLLPLVYDELRALARARLAKTPPGNTLQPTALVHEAYLRLIGDADPGWDTRGHFFASAARAMRDILVDQARRKGAVKHGGDRRRVDIDDASPSAEPMPIFEQPAEDMLALDAALKSLEQQDERKAQVVMLRFFAGLTNAQIAAALNISEPTVERDWRFARAFLQTELKVTLPEP